MERKINQYSFFNCAFVLIGFVIELAPQNKDLTIFKLLQALF
jgi:hypothetical protein